MSRQKKPAPPPTEQSELVDAPAKRTSKFTFADAERVTALYATEPLPTFPDGPGAAARQAILEMSGHRCDEAWRNA